MTIVASQSAAAETGLVDHHWYEAYISKRSRALETVSCGHVSTAREQGLTLEPTGPELASDANSKSWGGDDWKAVLGLGAECIGTLYEPV